MALVVLLRGVNVGGHRRFRPAQLAAQLEHLDVVNLGAAGTLVVRRAITQTALRAELVRRLPFATHIMICDGREIVRLTSRDPFEGRRFPPDVVRFVSVLARRPRSAPAVPLTLPATGSWELKVLARDGRFLIGVHRRHMKAIGYLGMLDRLFGAPATTRGWNTMHAVVKTLAAP